METHTGSDGCQHILVRKRNGGRMVTSTDYNGECSCCFLNIAHDMATHMESLANTGTVYREELAAR